MSYLNILKFDFLNSKLKIYTQILMIYSNENIYDINKWFYNLDLSSLYFYMR